jgi:hypothetical protein
VITRSLFTILPPIVTWGDITSKVDRTYVNHIIHVTHARPFGLVFRVLCLYILGLTRTTLVYARHIHGLYPRCMRTLIWPPIVTWGYMDYFSGDRLTKGEHIWYFLGIILFYATVVYLNTSTDKIHTITSNVNNARYDMVLHRHAWSPSRPPVWSPSLHRRFHDAIVVKPPVSFTQLTMFDHITSHAPTAKPS